MNIFISWSGPRSRAVAEALRNWLPGVLQSVDPWVSGADIEAGARWHQVLASSLEQCNFGVICLTPENLQSPWLLYEAGALSKSVEGSNVVPYLLGLRKVDVAGPLSHFQSVEADPLGTFALLQAMNTVMVRIGKRSLPDLVLRQSFELWWPKLDQSIQNALTLEAHLEKAPEGRNSDEMIQEIVENTRSIANVVESLVDRLSQTVVPKPIAQKSLTVEPEVMEATRGALSILIDSLMADIPPNVQMERALQGWMDILADKNSSLESLNEAYRGAKHLRGFIGR